MTDRIVMADSFAFVARHPAVFEIAKLVEDSYDLFQSIPTYSSRNRRRPTVKIQKRLAMKARNVRRNRRNK